MSSEINPTFRLDVALIHDPILGRDGATITTSLTPIDLHDIARSCRTYGVGRYYVVHPHVTMQTIGQRIRDYWDQGAGKAFEHNRAEAFRILEIVDTLEHALHDAKARWGRKPLLITTSARNHAIPVMSFDAVRDIMLNQREAVMLVFGTGWGLTPEMVMQSDALLAPIRADAEFNHLSVRSAVAIALDRIIGER